MNRVRGFGRRIFDLYDKYPLLMNSLSGGFVYSIGEIIAQDLVKKNKGKEKFEVKNDSTLEAESRAYIKKSYNISVIFHINKK